MDPQDWLDPDRAYMNGAFIAGADDFPQRWRDQAAAFRAGLPQGRMQLNQPYGHDPRQRFDLFLPEAAPRGVMVFIHGGYWMAFGREDWSHLAAGALARGWACAMPSYRLAPVATLTDITDDIRSALREIAARVPGPMVVTGHSAGGHLAARMGCADGPGGIGRVVPISPLSDLAPMMATAMAEPLHVTDADVALNSPARHALRAGTKAHVWVGGDERPAFLWQARVLAEAWGCDWTVDNKRHHFDVIDALADPASALMAACLDGM